VQGRLAVQLEELLTSRAAISKMRSFCPCNAAPDLISETRSKKIWNKTNNYVIRLHQILWRCLRIRTWIFYQRTVGWFDGYQGNNKWGLADEFKKVKQRLNLPPMTGKKTVASLRSLLTMWKIQRAAFYVPLLDTRTVSKNKQCCHSCCTTS